MWRTDTMFTYRNEGKVYGSPMFDDEYAAACSGAANVPPPQSHIQPHTYLPQQQQQQPQVSPEAPPTDGSSAAGVIANVVVPKLETVETAAAAPALRPHIAGPAVTAAVQHLRSVAVPWGGAQTTGRTSGRGAAERAGDIAGDARFGAVHVKHSEEDPGGGETGPAGGARRKSAGAASSGGRGGGSGGALKRKAGGRRKEASDEWDSSE